MKQILVKAPSRYVNLRKNPDVNSADIGDIFVSAEVEWLGEAAGWAHVISSGVEGYVSLQEGAVNFEPPLEADIVDVSEHNGVIDWDSTNASVAIIRSTFGVAGIDKKYKENIQGAVDAGLYVNSYHLFKPDLNGKVQAQYFWNEIKDKPNWVTNAVDVEIDNNVAPDMIARNLRTFAEEYSQLAGELPMIYTGAWFWNPHVGNMHDSFFGQCLLWVADYTKGATRPALPHGWLQYFLWQYSSDGAMTGFNGRVDLSRLP